MQRKALAVLVVGFALIGATAAGAAVIVGTPGDDVLRGTHDADRISAFAGDDLVYARAGRDDTRDPEADG